MLSTFLDRVSTLFNRRFLVSCWFPAFFALLLGLLPQVLAWGWAEAWRRWAQMSPAQGDAGIGSPQLWLLGGMLLLVSLVAYLLSVLARAVAHLYEGYAWPLFLRRRVTECVRRRWERLRKARAEAAGAGDTARYARLQERLHYEYPARADLLLPTRLGNVLRAAEGYSGAVYGMDGPFWWPRLWPLLPEKQRDAVEDALATMMAALNLALLLVPVTVYAAVYLALCPIPWRGAWAVGAFLAGGLLFRLCYRGAVLQARAYGQQIRVSVDLYRSNLFPVLRLSLPSTPGEERALWEKLSSWLYNTDLGAAWSLTYGSQEPSQPGPGGGEGA